MVLKPGGLATACVGECYAAIDVSNFIGEFSHYHGGKNSVVIMWKKEAFLEDCGCPSYDAEEFTSCRRSDWHTTLLVDNVGDTHAYSMYGFDRWAELEYADQWQKNSDGSYSFGPYLTSNAEAWKDIKWFRKLQISENSVSLSDSVENHGNAEHVYTLLYNLAPEAVIENIGPAEWLIKKHNSICRMRLQSAEAPRAVRILELKNCQKRHPRKVFQLQIEFAPTKELNAVTQLYFE
jgi:hypothetical protein